MSSVVGTIICLFTAMATYHAFMSAKFMEEHIFHVDRILIAKDYKRLISSGFLHANWIHFGFNMLALISFSMSIEILFGYGKYLLLYFASLIGGNLLSLYIHRNHGDYRALGASGAISGVIMASIVMFPNSEISFILLPFSMKNWIFGLLFIGISIFGIKSNAGIIGHDAHFGGAIIGVVLATVMMPEIIVINWWIILLILIPSILFIILIIRNPAVLMVDNYWGETVKRAKQKPVAKYKSNEKTLNELLEKINQKGIDSLSESERKTLDRLKDGL